MFLSPPTASLVALALVFACAGCSESLPSEGTDGGGSADGFAIEVLRVDTVSPPELVEGMGRGYPYPIVVQGEGFSAGMLLKVEAPDGTLIPISTPRRNPDRSMFGFTMQVPVFEGEGFGEDDGTLTLTLTIARGDERLDVPLPVRLLDELNVSCPTNEDCQDVLTVDRELYSTIAIGTPTETPLRSLRFDSQGPVRLRATNRIGITRSLDLSGAGPIPGPGGCGGAIGAMSDGQTCLGDGGGSGGSEFGGGGGGGYATAGENGDQPKLAGFDRFGFGGKINGSRALVPLVGGSGGGRGGKGIAPDAGDGGGGGGVLEVTSLGELVVSNPALAPGAFIARSRGGAGGAADADCEFGGGGGGAGGALLFRAPTITRGFVGITLSVGGGPGGDGGEDCNGGAGGDGRIRVDTATRLAGGFKAAVPIFRGPTFAVDAETLVSKLPAVVDVVGYPETPYRVVLDDEGLGNGVLLFDGTERLFVDMEPGHHVLCLSLSGSAVPSSEFSPHQNCIDIAYVPTAR